MIQFPFSCLLSHVRYPLSNPLSHIHNLLSLFVLYYLRFFAKLKLAKINPIIIGVTGSAGKTSCVAAIEAILKEKYHVRTTDGANSESGIPLSILGLKMQSYSFFDWFRVLILAPFSTIGYPLTANRYDLLVCEMGVDELTPPKNMEYLLTIVKPKIGVFLNALPVHTQQMKSVEAIAAEKGKLITSLPADGMAVLNAVDKNVAAFAKKTAAKVEFFGIHAASGYMSGSDPDRSDRLDLPGYALTNDYQDTFAAAAAVGKIFGISLTASRSLLTANFKLPPGRGTILPGINSSILIDSSYNASPIPTLSALKLLQDYRRSLARRGLARLTISNRRIAVLGDMRELGELAEKYHKQVAQKAYEAADAVITVGPLTQKYFPKNKKLAGQFSTSYEAGKFLQKYLQSGDLVLFKGSQNTVFLETAVAMCLKNKSDTAKLCRQGKFWDKQREKC